MKVIAINILVDESIDGKVGVTVNSGGRGPQNTALADKLGELLLATAIGFFNCVPDDKAESQLQALIGVDHLN